MNIWIISKYASSYKEGFESRLFAIARRFVKQGNATKIISSDSNHFGVYPKFNNVYNFHNIDGIDVLRIRTKKYYKTASFSRILSWLDFEFKLFFAPLKKYDKPDVIIISSLSLLTILNGILLKRKFKAKLVFEIRDIWPLTMVEEGGYSHRNPFVYLLGIIERLGYLKSDLVVGTMPNLKEHVSSVTGKSDINCICIPFGFDPVFYSKKPISKDIFSSKFDIPKDKFLVGYAGSLGLTNGLDAIIEASQKMKNDNRFHFIFLGDGDLKQKLINDTKEQKNVLFIPRVKREDVLSFLTLCNLLYFSSLKSKIWKFGWSPNKLIDYMMAEKPILASYSGHKSMIDEADSGFFVPAEDSDALVQILNDIVLMPPLKLQEMGMRGKEWLMNNRSWDVIANIYMDSLLKLYMKNRDVCLLGIGGHSKVIVEILNLKGFKLQGLYDDNLITHNQEFYGLKVSGPINSFESGSGVIAIGDNKIRKNINNLLIKVNWETLIHPSAIISKDVEIGEGTVIMAGAIIQPGVKIGKHCIINTGACIDHDCQINDYVHIAPNTSLAGGVNVSEGTLIGIGSSIIPNIKIGEWSKIGAGCVVINDLPDNCTVVGSPAKPIKFHNE